MIMIKHHIGAGLAVAAIAGSLLIASLALAEQRNFTVPVQEKTIDIGAGLKYDAWTYGGTVPGPVLRVRQGDKVHIHLVNDMEIAHGIDIHAAGIAPSKHFAPIPGKTDLSYDFVANVPGVFATIPVQEKTMDIGAGLKYDAWTYGGTVPGPVLRVRQGDKVHIHLVNDMEIAHGIDIHAAGMAPSKHFAPIRGKPTSATTSWRMFPGYSRTIAARRRWSPISPTECMG